MRDWYCGMAAKPLDVIVNAPPASPLHGRLQIVVAAAEQHLMHVGANCGTMASGALLLNNLMVSVRLHADDL
jgi:hypothetical protein